MAKKGIYANIHAKRTPTDKQFARAAKTAKKRKKT